MSEPQQGRIPAASATYTTAHGITRSLSPWLRPGLKLTISCFLIGFTAGMPWWELLTFGQTVLSFFFLDHPLGILFKILLLFPVEYCSLLFTYRIWSLSWSLVICDWFHLFAVGNNVLLQMGVYTFSMVTYWGLLIFCMCPTSTTGTAQKLNVNVNGELFIN